PSHRSAVSHIVPRTVAEAYRPCVRKSPLPCPHRLLTTVLLAMTFFFAVGLGFAFGFAPTAETARDGPPQSVGKSPPFRTKRDTPSGASWTVKTPPNRITVSSCPLRPYVDRSRIPFVVSNVAPNGATCPDWSGAPLISTLPASGATPTLTPRSPGGASC